MTSNGRPIAVVVGSSADDPPPGVAALEDVLQLRYAPDAESLSPALAGAQVMFIWRALPGVIRDAWDGAGDLRWIQTASAGVDALLFPDLIESDVAVTNARGVFDQGIAEWVVGAMLAFTTGLQRSIVDQHDRHWRQGRSTERLAGSHLVVAGPGPIGRGAGTRAMALGMTVTLVGRSERVDPTFGSILGSDRLAEAVSDADFVLDALPLTPSTRSTFDARVFGAMRPTARFLNVGRGATVDEGALIEALRSGGIAGAALDVFAAEPLAEDSPLWTMPTVIVSPHISGDVHGWERDVVDLFARNAHRWIEGRGLVNLVDKHAGHP